LASHSKGRTQIEKIVLSRIFGPKREEEAGGWRRLHNEELRNLYASLNIIGVIRSKKDKIGWAHGTDGRNEKCIQYFGL
jgi:hypothetical protein